MSDSLQPHGLQNAKLPCPSLSPRVSMMPSNQFIFCCPLLLLPSIFPSIRVFSNTRLFASGGQSFGSSASASVLPMNIQAWFPLGLIGLISLLSKGLSKSLLQHHSLKALILLRSAFLMVQLSRLYMTTGKTIALTIQTFVSKVMNLLFNTLSMFVIAFLPKSKHLLISGLQLPLAVILEPKKIKSVTSSTFYPSICCEVMGPDAMIFIFWMLSFKPAFLLTSFTFIRGSLVPLHFLPLRWYHLHIWDYWSSFLQFWSQPLIDPAWHFI